MAQTYKLNRYIIPAFMCLPIVAHAEVTADDVWANMSAYYTALGADVAGTLDRSDNVVTVNDFALSYTFPMDAGNITLSLPPLTLIEEGGAVAITVPDAFSVAVQGSADAESFDVAMDITMENFASAATGDPGAVSYQTSVGATTATMTDFAFSAEDEPQIDGEFVATLEGYEASSQVTEGDLIEGSSQVTIQPMEINYTFGSGPDSSVKSANSYGVSTATQSYAFPSGGSDIMNLTPALEAGLFVDGTYTTLNSNSRSTTTQNGNVVSDETTTLGQSDSVFRLGSDGLTFETTGSDLATTVTNTRMLPLPIDIMAETFGMNFALPVVAGEEAQDFTTRIGLGGLTFGDDLWNMMDPQEQLPRDPATFNMDLSGSIISSLNLFDFLSLENAFSGAEPPVQIERLNIVDITLSALGASAEASGEFVFDSEDLATFGGVPRPEGSATVDIIGANALADRLIAMGLIPEDQVFGARMMMGMFAREVGDDHLNSTVEINPEGHVVVNGQRVR